MYVFRTFMVPVDLQDTAVAITDALGYPHKGMFITPVGEAAMISTGMIEADSPLLGSAAELWAAVQEAGEGGGAVTLADCEAFIASQDLTESEPFGRMDFILDEVAGAEDAPAWVQPQGAHDAYPMDAAVTHNGKAWRSLVVANVWQPGVSGWRLVWGQGGDQWPEWVQPTGAHDAYPIGAKVTFSGARYVSLINNNVWSPAAYPQGWQAQPN